MRVKPLLSPARRAGLPFPSIDLDGLLADQPPGPDRQLVSEPDAETVQQAELLLRRTSFGPTRALVTAAARVSPRRWLESQLSPETLPDPQGDALVARFPGLTWSISQVRTEVELGRVGPDLPVQWLGQATVARAAWSRRQLLEVMVDLWSNHFNVPNDGSGWDSRMNYDTTVRSFALGRFADLLVGVSTHPAMLRYLATDSSTAGSPNEHHGRELLELHTIGPDADVTEAEVLSSARILTGLSLDRRTGELVYRPDRRFVGAVQVQGFTHPNGSAEAGFEVVVDYLQWLARRPQTARRVARLLAVRFVDDRPAAPFVDRLAKIYLDNDTELVPVLRALFASPEFDASRGTLIRRPMDDLLAAVRVLGVQPDPTGSQGIGGLYWALDALGQAPLSCPRPAGHSARGSDWMSCAGLVARWNAHLGLAGGWWPVGLRYPGWRALLPGDLPSSYATVVDALSAAVLLRPPTGPERAACCAAIGRSPTAVPTAPSLATDAPQLIALLLDSPAHCLT